MNLGSQVLAPASFGARLYVRARPHMPELFQTILDIGWIAKDVSRNTRHNQPSEFTDLVAGGNREFCDQPDLFYAAAYIDASRGREYAIRIAPSDAVCIHAVMTSHRNGVSTQTSWATKSPDDARHEIVLRVCDSPNDPTVLDSSPHQGLSITFVRLYFLEPIHGSKRDYGLQLEMMKAGTSSLRMLPPAIDAVTRFFPIRVLTITSKFVSFFVPVKRSQNKWTLTDVDRLRGFGARVKEFLVNERGHYFALNLSLAENETLEVLYRPKKHTWASIAFVTRATRTLSYMNLGKLEPESDGMVHLTVTQSNQVGVKSLSTHGRRIGTLLIREVSTDGRSLGKDVEMPGAVIRRG